MRIHETTKVPSYFANKTGHNILFIAPFIFIRRLRVSRLCKPRRSLAALIVNTWLAAGTGALPFQGVATLGAADIARGLLRAWGWIVSAWWVSAAAWWIRAAW